MTEVELLKPHTHAGAIYAPGDVLELDEATARWLIDQGVARPIESIHEED
jgi:hypothetical protein